MNPTTNHLHANPSILPILPYVVAIPTYNRSKIIGQKTLKTLLDGHVSPQSIYLFVANETEAELYRTALPPSQYHTIVIGKLGIVPQRNYIASHFPEHQYIISMDDDVEALLIKLNDSKMKKLTNLDRFFKEAYAQLITHHLYLWGIYPVQNPFYMKHTITTNLKFIIGVLFGYINRKSLSSQLKLSPQLTCKEDYQQSILYYKQDGGVVRFNSITARTKFNAEGGLGTDRHGMNERSAQFLQQKYPEFVTMFQRPSNGMTEIKLQVSNHNKKQTKRKR